MTPPIPPKPLPTTEREAVRVRDGATEAAGLCLEASERASLAKRRIQDGDTEAATREAETASRLAFDAMNALTAKAGATNPLRLRVPMNKAPEGLDGSPGLDLSALAMLDTPNARALLEALRSVQELAEVVDAERGRAVPAECVVLPGESRGTDYAESISHLWLKLSTEIHGPPSARGRE